MVERMKERRKNPQPAKTKPQGDDADMLNAAISQKPFKILLKHDERRGDDNGKYTERRH